MNRENILYLAEVIANPVIPGVGFNMKSYAAPGGFFENQSGNSAHKCHTVACFAGWAQLLFDECGERRPPDVELTADAVFLKMTRSDPIATVARAFGISHRLAYKLCAPSGIPWKSITLQQAVTCLHTLADTGEVDWMPAIEEHENAD